MSRSILIVDDNAGFLSVCRLMLRKQVEYNVWTSATSSDALSIVKNENPDLVLMDIRLGEGDINGVSCVAEMRAWDYQGIICMITEDHSLEMLIDAAIAGADDYWVKNGEENLLWEVENVFNHKDHPRTISSSTFQPVPDGAYLRSRGLRTKQIETLVSFLDHGFPPEKKLAAALEIKHTALAKRFSRIKGVLGYESLSQVAQLMTLLYEYCKRRDTKWR